MDAADGPDAFIELIARNAPMFGDSGPTDTTVRFEPDGEATRLAMEMDYEMPGKVPGFIKDLFAKGWGDRQGHKMIQDFKALAEAKVPAHA